MMPRLSPTEAEWQDAIAETAQTFGWAVFHARPARTGKGYRTPVQYDGVGFVDLVLVRDRVLFVEVKSERGRLSTSQRWWFERLRNADQDVRVWRPSMWTDVVATLRRRA